MTPSSADELRRRALLRLAERRERSEPPRGQELERLVEELRIHQFELEIQNEELARTRDDLERLVARYVDLYDFGPVGYLTLDPAGAVVEANLAAAALLAIDRSRLTGRRFADFFGIEERPGVQGCIARARDEGGKAVHDAPLHASVQRLHVRIEAVAAADGGTCRVALVDLTARRRAEAGLEASEARFRLLFESARDGIALLDAVTGQVLATNPAFCRALGGVAADYTGKALWEIEPLRSLAGSQQAFVELVGRGATLFEHQRLDLGADRHLDVELAIHSYRLGAGHVTQLGLRDIGERLRAERSLRDAQEHLANARRLEAVGRLAGGVAHEFNNQLGVILGCVEQWRRHPAADLRTGRRQDQIEASARRCADLTRQLLAFAGKQMLQPRLLAPSALVAQWVPSLSRLLGGKVAVEVSLEARGSIEVDPAQLEKVVTGLAAHGRRAMAEGGVLRFETADLDLAAPDATRPGGVAPGQYVTLTVSDSGRGLDPAARSLLFEPFFTGGPTAGSAGLELAAIHGTIEQSGGRLFVISEAARGTTFRILFPRVFAAAQPLAGPLRPVRNLLVVSDEAGVRELLLEGLGERGYEALVACDAEAALALAARRGSVAVDLLLTDVILPGLDGPGLARQMQALWPDLGVLFMSGLPLAELHERGLLAPGAALIQKPFSLEELVDRIRTHDGSSATGAPRAG